MDTGERPRRSPYGPAPVVRAAPPADVADARRRVVTPTVVVVMIFALGLVAVVGAGLVSTLRARDAPYVSQPIPTYVAPPVDTQPDAPEGAKPGSIAGFAAPRGGTVTDAFTLDQAVAASKQIADLSIAAAGPINDPAIPAGTTSFPVYPVGCGNLDGARVEYEMWFMVDDVPGGIERVRAMWEANGYVLDPTSSEGRYGYTGPATGPVDVVSIENKSGTVKLRVESVCTAGIDY